VLSQSFHWKILDRTFYSFDLTTSILIWFSEASSRGLWLHDNERVDMVIRERFRMREPGFYRNRIFKLVARWDIYINVLRIYVKRLWGSVR